MQPNTGVACELGQSSSGHLIRREMDDQLLIVIRGKIESFIRQPQPTGLGMLDTRDTVRGGQAGHRGDAAGELRAGDDLEFICQSRGRRIVAERSLLQGSHLLIGDMAPIRIELPGPCVTENEQREIGGGRIIEKTCRRHQPTIALGVSENIAQTIHHYRGSGLQMIQYRPDRRANTAGRTSMAEATEPRITGFGQAEQVNTLTRRQQKRIGDSREHRRRRVTITTLLESNYVLDADAGKSSEFGTTQTGRATPWPGRQTDAGRCDRLSSSTQEQPEFVVTHLSNLTGVVVPKVSLSPPLSHGPGSTGSRLLGAHLPVLVPDSGDDRAVRQRLRAPILFRRPDPVADSPHREIRFVGADLDGGETGGVDRLDQRGHRFARVAGASVLRSDPPAESSRGHVPTGLHGRATDQDSVRGLLEYEEPGRRVAVRTRSATAFDLLCGSRAMTVVTAGPCNTGTMA